MTMNFKNLFLSQSIYSKWHVGFTLYMVSVVKWVLIIKFQLTFYLVNVLLAFISREQKC